MVAGVYSRCSPHGDQKEGMGERKEVRERERGGGRGKEGRGRKEGEGEEGGGGGGGGKREEGRGRGRGRGSFSHGLLRTLHCVNFFPAWRFYIRVYRHFCADL